MYLWLKAFHIAAMVAWMAALLYLPRLFVYHSEAPGGSELACTLSVMEQRLLRVIMTPAMLVTWGLGLWLAWEGGFLRSGWLHAKFALVLVLSGLHGYLAAATRKFAQDRNTHSARHWRLINEVPFVILLVIVILVVVKPF
jgi:putative membrane protein